MRQDTPEGARTQVDLSMARIVGEWYLHSRSAHRNAKVIEAYRQLQVETDRLYTLFTRTAYQPATRVVFTRCCKPYESDEELICARARQRDSRNHLGRRRGRAPSSPPRM